MSWGGLLELLHLEGADELPLLEHVWRGVIEKVVENYVFELQSLALIHGKA
jgi:hypothetical protein